MRTKFASALITLMLMAGTAWGSPLLEGSSALSMTKRDAVVPGATVQIKDIADNSTRSVTSDRNGPFASANVNLKPNRCGVSVYADGFADFQVLRLEFWTEVPR